MEETPPDEMEVAEETNETTQEEKEGQGSLESLHLRHIFL